MDFNKATVLAFVVLSTAKFWQRRLRTSARLLCAWNARQDANSHGAYPAIKIGLTVKVDEPNRKLAAAGGAWQLYRVKIRRFGKISSERKNADVGKLDDAENIGRPSEFRFAIALNAPITHRPTDTGLIEQITSTQITDVPRVGVTIVGGISLPCSSGSILTTVYGRFPPSGSTRPGIYAG